MNEFTRYYDIQFSESAESGSIYDPLTILLQAAHEARMELLDKLPIGDLRSKVVVDFGTGSWGFACVYPRLQDCGFAIGIDISSQAIAMSEEKSRNGKFPYENRFKYLVSDGSTIPLEESSVDVFFAGECIEHVENTDVFLDEIHRVLRRGGALVLTTPNPNPWFYRIFGLEYAIGPEHISLMSFDELHSYLNPRFDIVSWQGYNSSVHPDLDTHVSSATFARTWAKACVDNPRDACGFVVLANSKAEYKGSTYRQNTFRLTSKDTQTIGHWSELPLHGGMTAHMAKGGASCNLPFFGDQIIVLFWRHDWSGIVNITVDAETQEIDLYSRFGGFKRVVYGKLDSRSPHILRIRATGKKNPLSKDDQVIFFTASSYQKA